MTPCWICYKCQQRLFNSLCPQCKFLLSADFLFFPRLFQTTTVKKVEQPKNIEDGFFESSVSEVHISGRIYTSLVFKGLEEAIIRHLADLHAVFDNSAN